MRIEAQGKYLQKIIEEQQKLGGALKASELLPSTEDNKQEHQSDTPAETSAGQSSPRKKQKTDAGLPDGGTSSAAVPRADQKNDFVNQWDKELYGNDAGFRFDLESELKEREEGVGTQKAPLELGPLCDSK